MSWCTWLHPNQLRNCSLSLCLYFQYFFFFFPLSSIQLSVTLLMGKCFIGSRERKLAQLRAVFQQHFFQSHGKETKHFPPLQNSCGNCHSQRLALEHKRLFTSRCRARIIQTRRKDFRRQAQQIAVKVHTTFPDQSQAGRIARKEQQKMDNWLMLHNRQVWIND